MNTNFATTLAILAAFLAFVHATDYCDPDLCGGATHIACGNSGAFGAACPADAHLVDINEELKKAFLNAHNTRRNFIAGGGDPKLSPACRMPEIQWDDEMASLATLNTKQCVMQHDACRNTDTFEYSGQNLAYNPMQTPVNYTALIESTVEMWYSERKDTYQEYIDAYPSGYTGPVIGHFTAMVTDKGTHVGCGITTHLMPDYPGWEQHFVACNYASTNILGLPIYKSCDVAASGCTTGVNCKYANLCKTSEPIDPNDIWN